MADDTANLCACGCGERVRKGRTYRAGHNKRTPWTWTEENRGYKTPCWIWGRSGRDRAGYSGRVTVGDKTVLAHRAVYLKLKGPIPEGLQLDHLCRVRDCVNPDHLEPVTSRENILRGMAPAAINARKSHCIYGHEFTEENTILRRDGGRECRTCRGISSGQRQKRAERRDVAA